MNCKFWLDSSDYISSPLHTAFMQAVPRAGDMFFPAEMSVAWAATCNHSKPAVFWRVTRVVWLLNENAVAVFVIPIFEDKETKPNE
jgi:hypothetical protein